MNTLHEGDSIRVWLKKLIQLPDEKDYYLVEDEINNKFIIPVLPIWKEIFENYESFVCKIDKINCSGKIYLEPQHPHYSLGKTYPFIFTHFDTVTSDLNEKRYLLHFTDSYSNKIKVLSITKPNFTTGNNIMATVINIKKGEIYIGFPDLLKPNHWIDQEIIVEFEQIKDDKLIFKDEFGCLHSIKSEIYEHYKLCLGQKYSAKIRKYYSDHSFKIEPNNPFYKEGERYKFAFKTIKEDKDALGKTIRVIVVEDIFGKEATITQYKNELLKNLPTSTIEAKVKRISNGRLYLED